ncbi:protein-tyrosine-phosphatase [Streptomyces nigrescens]|uniref:Protein-tyrosine-phosphatase n=2 Tax=Streptomyces TaxID=1883 RepID=A0ABN6QYE3_STRNI|nr:tyrosine-protein phosphatase [Streptomyces nigrescens]MEE4418020.1 tyrosine-protein phosphatase [Streptomyces sp. DSM 41528]BDM69641.1 protein-tyrosine-phosphatase [Streptomyces nigrescens]
MRTTPVRLTAAAVASVLTLGVLPAWAVADTPAQPPGVTAPQHERSADTVHRIALQGAVNVRDLGGYRTGLGQHVRYGQVFRADGLGKLTDADVAKLSALHLRTVVDFRVPLEVQREGADRLPAGLSATSRSVNDLGLYEKTMAAIGTKDPAKQQELLGDGKAEELMRSIYRNFVTTKENRERFAQTLRDIADHDQSPLLYHCTSGKDRTGWLSYLLLRAVGVPDRTATGDYLLSNELRAEADRNTREALKNAGLMQNPDLLIPLQEVREDYLRAALHQAEQDYGSLDGYLRKGLGLDTATLVKLSARLVR